MDVPRAAGQGGVAFEFPRLTPSTTSTSAQYACLRNRVSLAAGVRQGPLQESEPEITAGIDRCIPVHTHIYHVDKHTLRTYAAQRESLKCQPPPPPGRCHSLESKTYTSGVLWRPRGGMEQHRPEQCCVRWLSGSGRYRAGTMQTPISIVACRG